ncbi:MAG: LysO family transporter [Peptostreptococcaceae bacterium]|nr:LysO family transporter [Peptostreptococcaceae bacterium]
MSQILLLYIALLLLGMFLSRKKLFGQKVYDSMEKIQMGCLMVLLFAMGMNLGMNDEILKSFAAIGIKGILFGLITIVFSVLFVFVSDRLFIGKRGQND